jgi:integrase
VILGHASITMTLDLYGHLYPDEMDRWAARLSERAVANLWPTEANDEADDAEQTHKDRR